VSTRGSGELREWEWGLHVFFSADLVDSSALKHRQSDRWMPVIRQFFDEMQNLVRGALDLLRAESPIAGALPPDLRVWKANGDEILFECRAMRLEEVVLAERAFRKAVGEFNRSVLESTNPDRRTVRGTGWAAGFPLRNRRLFFGLDGPGERPDFIGPQIDLGFRLTKYDGHHPDLIVLSPELAWLLARAADANWSSGPLEPPLLYHGHHTFKGIAGGTPVPVFCTDTLPETELTTEDLLRGVARRPRCPRPSARRALETFLRSNPEWPLLPFIVGDSIVGPPAEDLELLEGKRKQLLAKDSAEQYGDDAMGPSPTSGLPGTPV